MKTCNASVSSTSLGTSHAVLLSQIGGAEPAPPPRTGRWQLTAYARYPGQAGGTAESGRTDYVPVITEASAITKWQGVTGGFYYLTQDGKLHYLTAAQ